MERASGSREDSASDWRCCLEKRDNSIGCCCCFRNSSTCASVDSTWSILSLSSGGLISTATNSHAAAPSGCSFPCSSTSRVLIPMQQYQQSAQPMQQHQLTPRQQHQQSAHTHAAALIHMQQHLSRTLKAAMPATAACMRRGRSRDGLLPLLLVPSPITITQI